MLRVINYGAACCVIEGHGVRILCDPWFTAGAYLGCWEREHHIPDPIITIGPCDYIWISHCHEDHYDPVFLRTYLTAYRSAQLIISKDSPHLARMMARDGFTANLSDGFRVLGTSVWLCIVANHGYENEIDNIDSALLVSDDDSVAVNMNDNPYDQKQIDFINYCTGNKHITALLPYTGAGPWPQCFNMAPTAVIAAAGDKRDKFLAQFERYRIALKADVAIPFSAGYKLRGPLAQLNPYRGIPRPQDVPNATVLPVTGAVERNGYVWEDLPYPTNDEIERLLQQASARSPKVTGEPLTIDLDWGGSAAYVDATSAPAEKAHETIKVDPRLLIGLLTRKFHWNTAEIASAFNIVRHADAYDPRVFGFLYKFHV